MCNTSSSRIAALLISMVLCGVLVTACDGDSSDPTDTGDVSDTGTSETDVGSEVTIPTTNQEIVEWLAETVCAKAGECVSDSRLLQELMSAFGQEMQTVEECEGAYLAEGGAFANLKLALDAGRVVFEQDKMATCTTAFEAFDCAQIDQGIPEDCKTLFSGIVAEGGACFMGEECVDNLVTHYCDGAGEGCGVCTTYAAVGESCVEKNCASGAICDGETSMCVEFEILNEGDVCSGSAFACNVFADTLCVIAQGAEEGTCQAADFVSTAGTACGPGTNVVCVDGMTCPTVMQGEEALPSTCTALVAINEMCVVTEGDIVTTTGCVAEAYCDFMNKTCTAKLADGQTCVAWLQCESMQCVGGVCGHEEEDPNPVWETCE